MLIAYAIQAQSEWAKTAVKYQALRQGEGRYCRLRDSLDGGIEEEEGGQINSGEGKRCVRRATESSVNHDQCLPGKPTPLLSF